MSRSLMHNQYYTSVFENKGKYKIYLKIILKHCSAFRKSN